MTEEVHATREGTLRKLALRKRTLTAGVLREALEGVPSETPVVLAGGSDHTYRTIGAVRLASAGFDLRTFYEWFSPEDNPGETPVDVVVLE